MGKTHYASGALFTAAAAPPISAALGLDLAPAELLIGVGIGTIAGVLPDIDHPQSLITKGLLPGAKKLGPFGKALGQFLSIPPRVIGVGARATMNHRGGTHSAAFMLLWTVLAAPMYFGMFALTAILLSSLLSPLPFFHFDGGQAAGWLWDALPNVMPLVMLCVFLGYLSHLVTDSMTNVPVPWPWPFSKARWSLLPKGLRITTDSFTENWLVRPIVLVLFGLAFAINIAIPMGKSALTSVEKVLPADSQKKAPGQRRQPGNQKKSGSRLEF